MFKRSLFFINIVFSTTLSAATTQITDIETTITEERFSFRNVHMVMNNKVMTPNQIIIADKKNSSEASPTQIPLPATLWLLAPVLIGLTQLRRQTRN
jgi:hypothetical protein